MSVTDEVVNGAITFSRRKDADQTHAAIQPAGGSCLRRNRRGGTCRILPLHALHALEGGEVTIPFWASKDNVDDGRYHSYGFLNRGIDSHILLLSWKEGPVPRRQCEDLSDARFQRCPMMIFDCQGNPSHLQRYFVLSAAKWVNDADSVLDEWDRWRT